MKCWIMNNILMFVIKYEMLPCLTKTCRKHTLTLVVTLDLTYISPRLRATFRKDQTVNRQDVVMQ